jgi:hypothetical protein
MSTIIAFNPDPTRRRPERARAIATCEIVIFPGVRYEYHETQAKPPRGRIKRDRLDVAD